MVKTLSDAAQSFINDLFLAGGVINNSESKQSKPNNWEYYSLIRQGGSNAKTICDEIIDRNFNLFAVDKALSTLSSYRFPSSLKPDWARSIKKTAEQLAEILAAFCNINGIYWDDVNTNRTQYELDNYKNNSLFGSALNKYNCYLSQQQNKTGQATTQTRAASQPSGPAGSAKAAYFQGKNSANARGLIGTPNQKIYPNVSTMYDLEFDKAGKNTIYLYVDTLGSKGDAGNNVNKVLEGSANGWSDAACYFDNENDLSKFLDNYVNKYGLTQVGMDQYGDPWYSSRTGKYINLKPARAKVDKNGYFKVNTDCGECYIKALKLNEDTEETDAEVELTEKTHNKISKEDAEAVEELAKKITSYDITDINVYESCEPVIEDLESQKDEDDRKLALQKRGELVAKLLNTSKYNNFDSFEENLNTYVD